MKLLEIADEKAFSSLILPDRSYVSYQLLFDLLNPSLVSVGRLGEIAFHAGSYVYTGSSRRYIRKRILRHLSRRKKLHWHIDYLLANPRVRMSGIVLSETSECELNRRTAGRIIVPRFGATDCREGCGSHLKFVGKISNESHPTRTNAISVRLS